jgi:hypothetical protein
MKVGLTVGEVKVWKRDDSAGIGVHLRPGLEGFGINAYSGEADTEKEAWARFHADTNTPKKLRDLTEVTINGGMTGDGPARDDLLVIREWNTHGVCDERVIGFDYGPDRQRQQETLARHLWIADAGDPGKWDALGYTDDELRAPFYRRADEMLVVIAGKISPM